MGSKGKVSSFQRKGKSNAINIRGTRPSIRNAQLLTSTGISSLDFLLGGGLPVGSVLLIEEDKFNVYSKLFTKYSISEGIVNDHCIFLGDLNEDSQELLKTLPSPCTVDVEKYKNPSSKEQMTIAWRYQDQKLQSNDPTGFNHNYDLTKYMEKSIVDKADLDTWKKCSECDEDKTNYFCLLKKIKQKIESASLLTSREKIPSNIMRVVLNSFGSPPWGMELSSNNKNEWAKLTKFLYCLKAAIRNSFSVAILTIPMHLCQDQALISRIYSCVDFVVNLESFQGSDKETNPIFKDYHGLFKIVKLPILNTLVPHMLDSTDWVFKLKRKSIKIEKLHLPPDISETSTNNSVGLCSSTNTGNKLDF